MRTRVLSTLLCVSACVLTAVPAFAQYGARRVSSNAATGETYHIEFAIDLWNPTPDIVISSESLGILGDNVDFVRDLGIQQAKFRQLKLVLHPAKKHKFRLEYTPIHYTGEQTLATTFVFNGQRYSVGLPVGSDLLWKAYRFGYEYDFVSRSRGFAGFLVEAKYTDIQASLTASFAGITDTEFTRARGPIPAIGGIGRVYVVPNISITGEFSGFPEIGTTGSSRYGGKYYDFDLYGTVNVNDHIGGQIGYRSLDVLYKVNQDSGTMKLKGLYFGAVARF